MENILGLSAPGGELDVPELAAALTRIYREEIISDHVAEFESWGFERGDLKEKDEVFFELKDEVSPGVFKTLESFVCVIMPVRLS